MFWGCFLFFLEKSQSSRNQSTQKIKQFNKANVKYGNGWKKVILTGIWGKLSYPHSRRGKEERNRGKKSWTSKLDPMTPGSLCPIPQCPVCRPIFLTHCFHCAILLLFIQCKTSIVCKAMIKILLRTCIKLTEVIYTKKLTQSSAPRQHPTQVSFPFRGSILPRGSPLSDFAILPRSGPTTFPHFSLHCFPLWNLHCSQAVLPIISQTSLPHIRLCLGSCWPFLDSLNNLVA